MQLVEKLDFSFSEKDFNTIDSLFNSYIQDRQSIYDNLFAESEYTEEEERDYINFFIKQIIKEEEQHPYLLHIIHFLNRNYEFFTLPEIYDLVQKLKNCFDITSSYTLHDEVGLLTNTVQYWEKLKDRIKYYPLLDINSYKKVIVDNNSVYYKEDSNKFLVDEVIKFVTKISSYFPKQISRLDSFIMCSPEYISFSGGESTFAYYIQDSVFLKNNIEEKDYAFYIETLYHEFGHFLFELITEKNQVLWYDLFTLWEAKKFKMSRENDNNEPEELFADAFSLLMTDTHDYLNPNLNPIILQYCKIILKKEFGVLL